MLKKIRYAAVLLAGFIILTGSFPGAFALEPAALNDAIDDTAAILLETVRNPQVGSVGGEWAVLGLARSSYPVAEQYYQSYYRQVEDYVRERGGILHDKKITEYSRLIVTLTAIGKNPADVAGYNLLTALGDYDKTVMQGMNGPIWALIALDSGSYKLPENPEAKTQATRGKYIDRILQCQLQDGGWSLFGGTEAASEGSVSDPDLTGMALQALSKYQDREDVKQATAEALECMSKQQNENGGYASWETENSESCVQMLVALCELGIAYDDPRFVKNGKTMLDNLMTYYEKGNGFRHSPGGDASNQMATEQGLYAMVAVQRQLEGKNSLYQMSDRPLPSEPSGAAPAAGLPGKNESVTISPVTLPGKTFADISAHKNQAAIEALASRGIISGKSEETFAPNEPMTRAEFAAILVKGLGLPETESGQFDDVLKESWFYPYVSAAYAFGIVSGVSDHAFDPDGLITREEAAVMVARSAGLCGMDTAVNPSGTRDALAGFTDYVKASGWAMDALAFCCNEKILPDDEMELRPQQPVTRAEIAQMLYQMLTAAKLL